MLAKIFGANYKTTLSAAGTAIMAGITWLSTISYDQGPISMVVPLKYKGHVAWITGVATLILWIYNGIQQKSKEVTGGTVQQTTNFTPAEQGTQTLVDETVKATVKSGEHVTPEQAEAVYQPKP